LTLSRKMWGTDQPISLEPDELCQMVEAIRTIEVAMGCGEIMFLESERPAMEKLRRI
jgi:sialic acid synthase SpsE